MNSAKLRSSSPRLGKLSSKYETEPRTRTRKKHNFSIKTLTIQLDSSIDDLSIEVLPKRMEARRKKMKELRQYLGECYYVQDNGVQFLQVFRADQD